MDKIKLTDLRNLNSEELILKRNTLKEELYKLNYQRRLGRVEKPHLFQAIKKSIARIETILNEKNRTNLKQSQNG